MYHAEIIIIPDGRIFHLLTLDHLDHIEIRKIFVAEVLPLLVGLLALKQVPHVNADECPWVEKVHDIKSPIIWDARSKGKVFIFMQENVPDPLGS
jgi:hypothetical protein